MTGRAQKFSRNVTASFLGSSFLFLGEAVILFFFSFLAFSYFSARLVKGLSPHFQLTG